MMLITQGMGFDNYNPSPEITSIYLKPPELPPPSIEMGNLYPNQEQNNNPSPTA